MTGPHVDRRQFLLSATALGLLTAASCSGGEQHEADEEASAGDGLAAGIAAIGSGYLASQPKLTESDLIEGLPAEVDPSADAATQLQQAHAAVTADFTSDRVERVNGWWVSRSEARIAALGVMRS